MNKQLILFDFDGTLANSFPVGMRHANKLAKYFSYPKLENLDKVRDQSAIRFIFSQVKWYYLPLWAYLMKRRLLNSSHEIDLFSEIPEMLSQLYEQFDLGIISGNSVIYQNHILDRYKKTFFKIQIGNNGTKKHRAIKKILKQGYASETTFFVGDDLQDMISAQRCGLKTIAVSWGSSSKELLKTVQPNKIAESVAELEQILLSYS